MDLEMVRTVLIVLTLLGLSYLALREAQDERINWSIFYALLYTSIALILAHLLCTHWSLWAFDPSSAIGMPYDIYFLWVVVWSVVPALLVAHRYFYASILLLIWLDVLIIPVLADHHLLTLSPLWLLGEAFLVVTVLLPAMTWSYAAYHKKWLWFRAGMQVVTIILIFIFGLPLLVQHYGYMGGITFTLHPLMVQGLLIIVLPGLVAVIDLVCVGLGTPFPYDPTTRMVRVGPYAYIRNPIQWSAALLFVPLAIQHHAPLLLLGTVLSVAYSIAVAEMQEYEDMEKRFGTRWTTYCLSVPKWYFNWKPLGISHGTLYFEGDCRHCSRIARWFTSTESIRLDLKYAHDFPDRKLEKVCYVDEYDTPYFGVEAIARGLDHINLALASLGWFMRLPGIRQLLDMIVYSMNYENDA